jgi:hypothetical protein
MSRMTDKQFQAACKAFMQGPGKDLLEEAVLRMNEAAFQEWLASDPSAGGRRELLHQQTRAASAVLSMIDNNAASYGNDKVQDK